jgi:hypothetical protein
VWVAVFAVSPPVAAVAFATGLELGLLVLAALPGLLLAGYVVAGIRAGGRGGPPGWGYSAGGPAFHFLETDQLYMFQSSTIIFFYCRGLDI